MESLFALWSKTIIGPLVEWCNDDMFELKIAELHSSLAEWNNGHERWIYEVSGEGLMAFVLKIITNILNSSENYWKILLYIIVYICQPLVIIEV